MKVLVTGGAGFIGSHLVDRLVEENHEVTLLDNLSSNNGKIPDYLNKHAKFVFGDIRNKDLLEKLIKKQEVIFHNASAVGIAQSNYEVSYFSDVNCSGTAKLMQSVVDSKCKPKVILSASNTTYGEGLYSCDTCGIFHPEIRSPEEISSFGFEPVCPKCKKPGMAIPTSEKTELFCNSVYALTKKFQEELLLQLGKLYDFPVVVLKYFNVFGTRQSLNNPYTGVSAIFMNRVKNGNMPVIYEDGFQTRDFISIHDVVEANILAMKNPNTNYEIFNVGSGKPTTIKSLAEKIYSIYNKKNLINITNQFRKGDIRHCISDISKIKKNLGWKPEISIEQGLKEIYEWTKTQESEDRFDIADKELKEKGLI